VADVQRPVGVGQGGGDGVAVDLLHGPGLGPRRYRRAAGGTGVAQGPMFHLSSTQQREHGETSDPTAQVRISSRKQGDMRNGFVYPQLCPIIRRQNANRK
jgi:hypothetical protein